MTFTGHTNCVNSIEYVTFDGGKHLMNALIVFVIGGNGYTICFELYDGIILIWDGHKSAVYVVEYAPFVVNNIKVGDSSNVICSGSSDNTIRFWDIRSNKSELHVIDGDNDDYGIYCLKFLQLKRNNDSGCDINFTMLKKQQIINETKLIYQRIYFLDVIAFKYLQNFSILLNNTSN
ncbi:hypothetical protein RFI_29593 [Reticulomyxa filosa]|uniref:Uncharacterized protein n=1 Tax=Reticulomyxa filosa TaxID=46433 RepID=X6M2W3_RETFI|nr:hypothetical protein RFI_29593 [Reticulomyxa filosa]|eukprot:ETO07797.1 hypothetical protein RFI_29593 [Reticulomyxa filosa]